jgi:hypothetical protein
MSKALLTKGDSQQIQRVDTSLKTQRCQYIGAGTELKEESYRKESTKDGIMPNKRGRCR